MDLKAKCEFRSPMCSSFKKFFPQRSKFHKVCSLKEILKCPESILGCPRAFHLNDQEDKAISSIVLFFCGGDLRRWKMYSVLSLLQHISTLRTSLGVLPWWGGGLSTGCPRCAEWDVPSQDPRSIPFHLPPLVTARSVAEPDGPVWALEQMNLLRTVPTFFQKRTQNLKKRIRPGQQGKRARPH